MTALTLKATRGARRTNAQLPHQATLTKAFEAFSAEYPRWANSLFDLYFLREVPAELLGHADAIGLARAWMQQFPNRNPSLEEQDVRRAAPVAKAFVRLYLKTCSQNH